MLQIGALCRSWACAGPSSSTKDLVPFHPDAFLCLFAEGLHAFLPRLPSCLQRFTTSELNPEAECQEQERRGLEAGALLLLTERVFFSRSFLPDFLLNLIKQNCIRCPVLTAQVIRKETMCFSRLYSGGRQKKNSFGIFVLIGHKDYLPET